MKKVVTYPGGMPIRPDDFALVQEQALLSAFQIIKGLSDTTEVCIVSGLKITTVGTTNNVSSGYIWDGVELCYVPEYTFTTEAGRTLYLVLSSTFSENRRFKDDSYHNVYQTRSYNCSYQTSEPDNSYNYSTLSRLVNLLSITPDANTFQLTQSQVAALETGFAHALGEPGTGFHVLTNAYNEMMLVCYFTATVTSGVIANIELPVVLTNEIIGYFWNGSAVGYLKIRPDGDVSVANAATGSTVNIIQFQVNLNAVLPS
jgi:hypothetical protein